MTAEDKSLKNKVCLITGASRGIGLAIALRAAQDGASIVVAAKTDEPHPKLPGTIHTAANAINAAGGNALAVVCDIRQEDQVKAVVDKTIEHFGALDILVNNASAISLTGTQATDMKRFDLMQTVNGRGTFVCSKYAIEHLLKSQTPHILNISPPLNLNPRWFGPHLAYTMAKYGMSLCTLGMAEEFKGKIAVNSLWPESAIATAAVGNLLGGEKALTACRKPEIMADAAYQILTGDVHESGNFYIDTDVLKRAGVSDFTPYAVNPDSRLIPDFFLD
jgi:citronellol/citronellal dehydrogenase